MNNSGLYNIFFLISKNPIKVADVLVTLKYNAVYNPSNLRSRAIDVFQMQITIRAR